jgi:hypothetical protein
VKPADTDQVEKEGDGRNRTGVHGFAGRCLTTRPRRHGEIIVAGPYPSHVVARCGRDNGQEGGSMYIGGGLLALIIIILLLVWLF